MGTKARKCRFPIFEDHIGAKNPYFENPFKQQPEEEFVTADEIEQPVTKIDVEESKRQALHTKDNVQDAILDARDFNVLKERVVKQTKSFSTTSTSTNFIKQIEADKQENKKEVQPKPKVDVKKSSTAKAELDDSPAAKKYRSFANEKLEHLGDNYGFSSEIEKIPLVKQEMRQRRENMEDSVPFHRKHKKG